MRRSNSNTSYVTVKNYCEHFESVEQARVPPVRRMLCSICKAPPPNVWVCLGKGCGMVVCGKSKYKHLLQHMEDLKGKHCVFINSHTTEIRCLQCKIEVLDFDEMELEESQIVKHKLDPLVVRERFSRKDVDNSLFKNGGNLENSAAHKRTSQGLCGLLSRKGETAVSSVVQFFSSIGFMRETLQLLQITATDDQSRLLKELIQIVNKMWSGDVRIFAIQSLETIVTKCLATYRGYSKKDPFQLFILVLNIIHEEVKFSYHVAQNKKEPERVPDEWEMLQGQNHEYSPVKNNLHANMVYKMKCLDCEAVKQIQGELFKIELEFPKVRRESKVLESEFQKHKFESPFKNRRKSLADKIFRRDAEIPVSLVQLIIHYFKTRFPSNKALTTCEKCKKPMIPLENKLTKLPNLMLIIVQQKRDPSEILFPIDVEFPLGPLDMKGFVEDSYEDQTVYDFQAAICERDYEYLTLARTNSKHVYEYTSQGVKMTTETSPPLILCYCLRNRNLGLYRNIHSNVEAEINPEYQLPDLWLQQLKYFQPTPLINPRVCKHNKLKPVDSKLLSSNYIPKQIYMALVEKFGGRVYINEKCHSCFCEVLALTLRKRKEKEFISRLDSYRCKVYCMISCQWLNKWTEYLYKKRDERYIVKGNPDPGAITNSVLLEGTKCKQDLKKGEDYKLVSFYVWSFFKELYGGGPEIQYKTRSEDKNKIHQYCDEQILQEIKQKAREMRQIMREEYYLAREWVESPLKRRESRDVEFQGFETPQKE